MLYSRDAAFEKRRRKEIQWFANGDAKHWRDSSFYLINGVSIIQFISLSWKIAGNLDAAISRKRSAFKCKYYIIKSYSIYFSRCRFNGSVKLKLEATARKKEKTLDLFALYCAKTSLENRSALANICRKKFVCVRPKIYSPVIYPNRIVDDSLWQYLYFCICYVSKMGCNSKKWDVPSNFNSIQIKSKMKFMLNPTEPNRTALHHTAPNPIFKTQMQTHNFKSCLYLLKFSTQSIWYRMLFNFHNKKKNF